MMPLPQTGPAAVVVVVLAVVIVVLVLPVVLVVVVVDAVAQPYAPHASQQLAYAPTQPPFARQRATVVIRHLGLPVGPLRQHATRPGCPHVERAAHSFATSAHAAGR